mmetsp:Transcript_51352/g.154294  ORF Transcript_51352/g.154294 Transcript_51352/m.154294 type:complete len:224 (+) Transcript_51352:1202-1873(+)
MMREAAELLENRGLPLCPSCASSALSLVPSPSSWLPPPKPVVARTVLVLSESARARAPRFVMSFRPRLISCRVALAVRAYASAIAPSSSTLFCASHSLSSVVFPAWRAEAKATAPLDVMPFLPRYNSVRDELSDSADAIDSAPPSPRKFPYRPSTPKESFVRRVLAKASAPASPTRFSARLKSWSVSFDPSAFASDLAPASHIRFPLSHRYSIVSFLRNPDAM